MISFLTFFLTASRRWNIIVIFYLIWKSPQPLMACQKLSLEKDLIKHNYVWIFFSLFKSRHFGHTACNIEKVYIYSTFDVPQRNYLSTKIQLYVHFRTQYGWKCFFFTLHNISIMNTIFNLSIGSHYMKMKKDLLNILIQYFFEMSIDIKFRWS